MRIGLRPLDNTNIIGFIVTRREKYTLGLDLKDRAVRALAKMKDKLRVVF